MVSPRLLQDFMRLFQGRTDAYGTGAGRWVKSPPMGWVYTDHLEGKGEGLGIAPLMDDGRVWFAAVDLDEPDFEAAEEISAFLSFDGHAWVERSRSGNAHVWCFFAEPIDAWIPRGIMREATAAIGKPTVEVFPKADKLREGMLGSYINLPYHGDARPMLSEGYEVPVESFVRDTLALDGFLNSSNEWRKRADWLMISPPEHREQKNEFGKSPDLHICAQNIIARRDEVPVSEGHRNVVYFCLAKMLSNWESCGQEEALQLMKVVRDSSDAQGVDHVSDSELRRILRNAEQGEFSSTGCDDPLMAPYVDPACRIAHPNA